MQNGAQLENYKLNNVQGQKTMTRLTSKPGLNNPKRVLNVDG